MARVCPDDIERVARYLSEEPSLDLDPVEVAPLAHGWKITGYRNEGAAPVVRVVMSNSAEFVGAWDPEFVTDHLRAQGLL